LQLLEEIIDGCRKRKQNAQKHLFERYSERLFGLCLYYTRNNEEAEDILHDGFIRVFENIDKYREGNFEAWMRKVFVNLALTRFRRKGKMHLVDNINDVVKDSEHSYFEAPMHHDELLTMVRTLSPQYQLVFNLYAIEGYSHKEIAQMLRIDEGTSKSNLSRARKILQSKLKETIVNE
jgi:RNA polymerase sigma-70 factor (ECF subfamily)